jgi:hypothetical protein
LIGEESIETDAGLADDFDGGHDRRI